MKYVTESAQEFREAQADAGIVVGIDASRNRSGGAKVHLRGILTDSDPTAHGIREVHVWSYQGLLDALPNRSWLVKHHPAKLEGSLLKQALWQRWSLPREARDAGCQVLLNTHAGSVCRFRPAVVMSREMLSYEPGEMQRYGISKARLRIMMLRLIQNRSLRFADGVVFLTNYASRTIQRIAGPMRSVAIIPHGVGDSFKRATPLPWPESSSTSIECLYVSNAAPYKHQWHVVRAIALLRENGRDLKLTLVGGGSGRSQERLEDEIRRSDPQGEFVRCVGFVDPEQLPSVLQHAHLFIFASSCENMPNTLLEAMAAGLPIACSNRGPMPEVLGEAGTYFDPEEPASIARAVEQLLDSKDLREASAAKARSLASAYSWTRCGGQTWRYLRDTMRSAGKTRPYQVCTKCVMDTTDSKIEFDANGVCDHCRTFYRDVLPNWRTDESGQRELRSLVANIKKAGRGKDFDCIIGMSGGIDSSYLTYVAATELGLRPLAFHVDAGWNSQIAVNNIEKLIDKLGLDLYTEVIDWEEMRDLQLAYFKSGVPHIDTPQDHAFFATMYKFAEQHHVNYILTGANFSTECIRNPVEWMYYQSDSIQLRDIHRRFGTKPLVNFPTTSVLRHKIVLPYLKGIRVVRPLNYIPYSKQGAIDLLTEQFGWQPYPQKHFESRFTRFYEGFWLPTRFGFDTRRVQFSSLIVTGQMTPAEALAKLAPPALADATVRQEFEYVATKLGISVQELEGYLHAPKKSYRDYKSQEAFYAVGAEVMKKLRLELGGKR